MPPLEQFLFYPPGLDLSVYIFNKLTRMIFVSYLFLYLNSCIVSLNWYISKSLSWSFRASSSIFSGTFSSLSISIFSVKGKFLWQKKEMAKIVNF